MSKTKFELYEFQETAAHTLSSAAVGWLQTMERTGSVLRHGRTPIPFLGQLRAITGSGKTPILARVVSNLGPSIVVWTTKSSVVVQQTITNLNGKYRHLLPPDTTILREIPSPAEWRDLFRSTRGTTIWVLTVASWNDAEAARTKGNADARLSLHRPQLDWAGDQSPWDQLRDESKRKRPLWVVYDESHGQTTVQLDQLVGLRPKGVFAASATPVTSGLFGEFRDIIRADSDFAPALDQGDVHIKTSDVARAGLLKSAIKIDDRDQDPEEIMSAVVTLQSKLAQTAKRKKLGLSPKAVWVVEQSNVVRGSHDEARPVAIWKYLTERKRVAAETIAVCTDTRDLPRAAEKVQTLEALLPTHTNIIFNQSLQEGWDDPEAYIAYFDGATKSATRITQVIGRVIRQPNAQKYDSADLNTAYLFIRCPNERFDEIAEELRAAIKGEFGEDDEGQPTVKLETRRNSFPAVPVRKGLPDLSLPVWVLGKADLDDLVRDLRAEGDRTFAPDALEAPGQHTWKTISLERDDARIISDAEAIGLNARVENREYLLRQLRISNRAARHALDADALDGPMYSQLACVGSHAYSKLAEDARGFVDAFEGRVTYNRDPNPARTSWVPGAHKPTSQSRRRFRNSVHREYATSAFNKDELPFAQALDDLDVGYWMRNPAIAGIGYGIQLPKPVGSSNTFFPDFLWWVGKRCFAIDTTGKHLLDEKIRGKLLALETPLVSFVVRGRLAKDFSRAQADGWTLVRPNAYGRAEPSTFDDLRDLIRQLAAAGGVASGLRRKSQPSRGATTTRKGAPRRVMSAKRGRRRNA